MTGRHDDAGRGQLRDDVGRRHLGRQRHQGPAAAKGGQQPDRAFVETAQFRGIMHALACDVQVRAFDVDAEHAGHLGVDRGAHGLECARDDMQVVADERRQKPGGAEAAMGAADLADGVDGRLGVEEHAAAAVYLRVEKARQQQMAAEIVAGCAAAARVVAGDDVDDPSSVEQHGAVIEDAGVAEHPAVDQRDRHQTVSVTLRRCGGRSGSQAARDRERVGEPVEALDHQQRFDRRMRAQRRQREDARDLGPRQQDLRAEVAQLARQRFDAFPRLVVLREREHRKPAAHERHRTVAQFRGAECLGVQAAGFLELERGFLGDAETEPAADDVEAAGRAKVLDGGAPVELPRECELVRAPVPGPSEVRGPASRPPRGARSRRARRCTTWWPRRWFRRRRAAEWCDGRCAQAASPRR